MKSHQKKIVIADDDAAILDVLTIFLEDLGYEVVTTQDAETLRTFENGPPDVVVLDIWMSGWHGADICRFLKNQEATKSLPILLISATRDTESIALEAGADDFLAKPFDLEELLGKIQRYA